MTVQFPATTSAPADHQLLHLFAMHGDHAAFAQLVQRYRRLVFASAVRRTRDVHLAEDVTQAVFLLLSQKASQIGPDVPLAGWLHRAAGYAASNAIRMKTRREKHEQIAAKAQADAGTESVDSDQWPTVAPLLDGLVDRLREPDRSALLARFVQGLSVEEVATTLGVRVEAAKKRIQRAVEKLRKQLTARGIAMTATTLGAILQERAAASPASIPSGLTESILQTIKNPVAGGPAAQIAKGASHMLWWQQFKSAATISLGCALVLGGAGFALNRALAGGDSSPLSSPTVQVSPRVFNEIMDITIRDDQDCIDLDTGKNLTNNLRVRTREEGRVWWRESGADAHCETTSTDEECGLYGMGVAWVLVDNSALAEMSADELDRQLAAAGEPQWDNLMPAAGELPVTYLYKTKDGGMGIVQFVAMEKKESPALKVKLKVVKK